MTFDKVTNEPIVSMLQYKDCVLVATPNQIFRLLDGKLEPLQFEYVEKFDDNTKF